MRKLLIIALLLAGCASYRAKIQVPGCKYPIIVADGCDPTRSFKMEFPDRVEFHCVKDIWYEGKIRTQEQVWTYRCTKVKFQEEK